MSKGLSPPPSSRQSLPRPAVIIALVAVGLGISIVRSGGLIAVVVPAAVGVLLLAALVRHLDPFGDDPVARHRLMWWTMAAFAAHFLFGLVVTNVPAWRSYLATDSYVYHADAVAILRHWTEGFPGPDLPSGKEGFYYLLAGLYRVFGPYTSAGLAVNAALGAALVPLTTDTTRRLFGPSAARYVPPLVVLMPGIFMWTSQLLKEAAILFLIAVAVNCATRITERLSLAGLMGLSLSLSLLFTFRAWVALVVAQGLVAAIALGSRHLLAGFGTGIGAVAVITLLVVAVGLGYSGYEAAVNTDLKEASAVRQDLATSASSGYAEGADISTGRRALSYLPIGLVNFSLGPFPWDIGGPRELPALVDVVVLWALLPSLCTGLRQARVRIRRRVLVLVLPALATSILLALAVGNFGTVARERLQVVIVLLPLIALGLAERARRRSVLEGAELARAA